MAGFDNNKSNQDDTTCDNDIDITDQDVSNDDNMSEEYYLLDSKLDELNSALDFLEKRTDDIHEKLKELLQSNIEIRNELRNENMKSN
ncbi:unnamed protein product [Diatraea saccharalis]|uniref:Uncharacterized protein n=1 Tax=Diatraea saccharalis TaxID=40085 RepID=A0A9N9QVZ4_9NEOP|nr:unnamed protein product [Diatraea saccharalis]